MILFEGENVVCILTGYGNKSENSKTGQMLQTWILHRKMHPVEAVVTGKDSAICGNCPHRGDGFRGRSCYVDILKGGPSAVYQKYIRGGYDRLEWSRVGNKLQLSGDSQDWLLENVAGRVVRFGSYGDPAFVPVAIWDTILEYASGNTGYTHQWRVEGNSPYKRFLMASCDSESDLFEAQSAGWRTFRVRSGDMPIMPKLEIVCPASEEAGKRRTCATCKACDGAGSGRSVTIIAHGKFARNFKGDGLGVGRVFRPTNCL